MDAVLKAWCDSDVTHTIVVLRKDDRDLVDACQAWPVEIVRPIVDPRDMKESIQYGLRHLSESHAPTSQDRWMVAPADVPTLAAEVINQLLVASETTTGVIAARFGGRQGHPVSLPWSLSTDLFKLDDDAGLDRFLAKQEIAFVDFAAELRPNDVDTPEDYDRMRRG